MADINEATQKLDEFLNDTLDEHEARLLKSLDALEKKITSLYARLDVDTEGNIKGPKWTLRQAQELHKKLINEFAAQTDKEIEWLDQDYKNIEIALKEFAGTMGIDEAYTNLDKKMLDTLKAQSFQTYEALTSQTVAKIAQSVYDAVVVGMPFSKLSNQISAHIVGYKDIAGRPLTQYAGTYAHDAIMSYSRTLNEMGAGNAGLTDYWYYGDVIRDSRPFCVERAGKVFTRAEVEAWNDMSWAGKSGNVWTCLGGYRCRHHLRAVRREWVEGIKE